MIRTETLDRIATIEIARPDKKNALTTAMYAAMTDALAALALLAIAVLLLERRLESCKT